MKLNAIEKKKIEQNVGHRERLRDKLFNNGYEGLYDYEIVELMLFLIFKRKDTKLLAKELIKEFKTIDGILNAKPANLLKIEGIGKSTCETFTIVNEIIKAYMRSRIIQNDSIKCFDDVIKYCSVHMKYLKIEEFRILFLNGTNKILSDIVLAKGGIDEVGIYPREVVRIALDKGAKSVILIHNHPNGNPTPSGNDIIATKRIKEALDVFDIKLFDHIIIGDNKYISFKNLGLLCS